MDFQEFNELRQRKDDNVINLKYAEAEDEKEEKEQVGKTKVFDFNYSSSSDENDHSKNEIIKKVLRGEALNYENYEQGENHETTNDDIKSNKKKKKDKSHELLSENENEDISPKENLLTSRKNIGSFHDECEKQQIRQIIYEMHNPQERLKMCLIDVKQQTVEELIRDITEANQQANPHMRKQVYHQRRNRYQTTLELPHQIQQFNMNISNQQSTIDISKQQDQVQEKQQQSRMRMASNHSTTNNITSQSSMHTINNGNERERFGSGDDGTNQAYLKNENTNRKVLTLPFIISKNQLNSADEIDSKGIITTANNINGNTITHEETKNPQEQFQRRQQFKRNSQKQNSNGRKLRSDTITDSQMLVSIRIDHNTDSANFLGPHIKVTNTQGEILKEGEEASIHKQLKGLHEKLYTKQISLVYEPSQNDLDEEIKQKEAQNELDEIPFLGKTKSQNENINTSKNKTGNSNGQSPKYHQGNNQSPKSKKQSPQNKRQHTLSPQNKRSSKQSVKINDQKQDLYDNYKKQAHEFRQRTITNVIYEQASEQNTQTYQQQEQSLGQKDQSPEQKNGRLSNGSLSQFQLKPTANNIAQSFYSTKQSISSADEKQKEQKVQKTSNDDENMDNVQTSLGQFDQGNISDQQHKFITNKMRLIRSNTVFYDQEKKMNLYKKVEEMSTNHNHVVQNDQPQEGCIACEFQQLMKQANNPKDKQPEQQEAVDTNKLFKEIPIHVIEHRFFMRQVSLLKQNNEEIDNTDRVFVLGNKNNPELSSLRVYFFSREDTFIDFKINTNNTTIQTFVKFAIQCYKIKSNLNQGLLKFPEQPSRYKIYPNISEKISEIHKPNLDIPEFQDNMTMLEVLEDSNANACCFIEIDDCMESISVSHTHENGPELDLKEFQSVYSKQYVFKVEFKEKDYYTFLRLGKDKNVEDIFEDLQKKKKIDIDKRNYIIVGRIVGSENTVTLDLNMPLSIINDSCLKIQRREYEDRQGGTIDENKLTIVSNHNNILGQYSTEQEDSMDQLDDDFDDEDEDEEEINSQQKLAIQKMNLRKGKKMFTQLNHPLDPTQVMKYEEFEVIKESINISDKKSKRIIGIDENFIYNRKIQTKLFSVRGLLCFLFPASTSDTKCPQKKIDDIKYMCTIEGGKLLIQFTQKDILKQWLLYNPDPYVTKRMFQKLTFLRKSEVRVN